jgi:uncharacterized protein (TIGR03067 family)
METKKLLFITAVLSLAFGCSREVGETADSSEESGQERAKLEGTWIQVRGESRFGSGVFDELSFRGKQWARETPTLYSTGIYRLDPSKFPKWIDFRATAIGELRWDSATDGGPVFLGIYNLDGDRLIICHSGNANFKGEARPNAFQPASGTYGSLSEYERAPEGIGRLWAGSAMPAATTQDETVNLAPDGPDGLLEDVEWSRVPLPRVGPGSR